MGAGNGKADTETGSQVGCKGSKGVPSMTVMGTFRCRPRPFAAAAGTATTLRPRSLGG